MTTKNNDLNDNLTSVIAVTQCRLSWLSRVWNSLADALNRKFQPRISYKYARSGHCYWHAYDPRTGQSASLGSEADVLWWLEQLHHH